MLRDRSNKKKQQENDKVKQFLPNFNIEGTEIDVFGNICLKRRQQFEKAMQHRRKNAAKQETSDQQIRGNASRSQARAQQRLPDIRMNSVSQLALGNQMQKRIENYRSRSLGGPRQPYVEDEERALNNLGPGCLQVLLSFKTDDDY